MFDFEFVKAQIKNFVSIRDVFDRYVGNTKQVADRFKCPFNPREDRYNFGIKNGVWHCFSCGCSGDEISFVQKLYDLPVVDAMKKIAFDFHLNTEANSEDEKRIKAEAERRERQRKANQEREEKMQKLNSKLYNYIIKKIRRYEEILQARAPKQVGSKREYMESDEPLHYTHALAKIKELNHYADILCEVPTPEYNPFEIGMTKDELHARQVRFLNKVYKGEIVI